jgi:hypothetical protein
MVKILVMRTRPNPNTPEGVYTCYKCGKLGATMRCGRCAVAYYCDAVCQKAHWKANHKHDCPHFAAFAAQEAQQAELIMAEATREVTAVARMRVLWTEGTPLARQEEDEEVKETWRVVDCIRNCLHEEEDINEHKEGEDVVLLRTLFTTTMDAMSVADWKCAQPVGRVQAVVRLAQIVRDSPAVLLPFDWKTDPADPVDIGFRLSHNWDTPEGIAVRDDWIAACHGWIQHVGGYQAVSRDEDDGNMKEVMPRDFPITVRLRDHECVVYYQKLYSGWYSPAAAGGERFRARYIFRRVMRHVPELGLDAGVPFHKPWEPQSYYAPVGRVALNPPVQRALDAYATGERLACMLTHTERGQGQDVAAWREACVRAYCSVDDAELRDRVEDCVKQGHVGCAASSLHLGGASALAPPVPALGKGVHLQRLLDDDVCAFVAAWRTAREEATVVGDGASDPPLL